MKLKAEGSVAPSAAPAAAGVCPAVAPGDRRRPRPRPRTPVAPIRRARPSRPCHSHSPPLAGDRFGCALVRPAYCTAVPLKSVPTARPISADHQPSRARSAARSPSACAPRAAPAASVGWPSVIPRAAPPPRRRNRRFLRPPLLQPPWRPLQRSRQVGRARSSPVCNGCVTVTQLVTHMLHTPAAHTCCTTVTQLLHNRYTARSSPAACCAAGARRARRRASHRRR